MFNDESGHGTLAASLVLSNFGSLEAVAQQATSFEQLQVLVKRGTQSLLLIVRELLAKAKSLNYPHLLCAFKWMASSGTCRESEVLEIKQRRSDSLANGAKIGALVGVAVGVLGAIGLCKDSDVDSCPAWAAASIGFYTGLGAGIGVGIDALIVRQMTIYRARNSTSSSRITLTPVVSCGRKGIRLSVSF